MNTPLGAGPRNAPTKVKIIGGVVAAIAIAVGGFVLKGKLGRTARGNLSYRQVGLDPHRPDADKMISAVAPTAHRWRRDAVWWAINLQAVHADGTVEVGRGAVVTYISPYRVKSLSKKVRRDSIKKYSFGQAGIRTRGVWGARKAWKNVVPPAAPACSIKQLTSGLSDRGLTGDKTVRVSFDPQFAGPAQVDSWHVIGKDPKIDAYFSMVDCTPVAGS